jgi:hypothetical protein
MDKGSIESRSKQNSTKQELVELAPFVPTNVYMLSLLKVVDPNSALSFSLGKIYLVDRFCIMNKKCCMHQPMQSCKGRSTEHHSPFQKKKQPASLNKK